MGLEQSGLGNQVHGSPSLILFGQLELISPKPPVSFILLLHVHWSFLILQV